MTFWQLLHYALSLSGHECVNVTQSTHSTPATQNPITYGGTCIQAVLNALAAPYHDLAWRIAS